jgi:MscS family membrane protein
VEEIGLRSTVIRTLNRTLVSIPNSVFSAAEVENFSERDRIRYYRHLRLEVGSRALMEIILLKIRELFAARDQIYQDTVSIRLEEIADNTAQIRIDAGVRTTDYQQFLEVAEALNLSLIDIVTGVGARFSGPTQNVTIQQPQDIGSRESQENMSEPLGIN